MANEITLDTVWKCAKLKGRNSLERVPTSVLSSSRSYMQSYLNSCHDNVLVTEGPIVISSSPNDAPEPPPKRRRIEASVEHVQGHIPTSLPQSTRHGSATPLAASNHAAPYSSPHKLSGSTAGPMQESASTLMNKIAGHVTPTTVSGVPCLAASSQASMRTEHDFGISATGWAEPFHVIASADKRREEKVAREFPFVSKVEPVFKEDHPAKAAVRHVDTASNNYPNSTTVIPGTPPYRQPTPESLPRQEGDFPLVVLESDYLNSLDEIEIAPQTDACCDEANIFGLTGSQEDAMASLLEAADTGATVQVDVEQHGEGDGQSSTVCTLASPVYDAGRLEEGDSPSAHGIRLFLSDPLDTNGNVIDDDLAHGQFDFFEEELSDRLDLGLIDEEIDWAFLQGWQSQGNGNGSSHDIVETPGNGQGPQMPYMEHAQWLPGRLSQWNHD